MEILPVEVELFDANRRTDREDMNKLIAFYKNVPKNIATRPIFS
jgi:hypothetical protein